MKRVIVSVATTAGYQRGMQRLYDAPNAQNVERRCWMVLPPNCPPHSVVPYAFKAFALQQAAQDGFDTLLWADACINPIRDMTPLWERIERDGYWIARNGWTNDQWTADSAYRGLFPADQFETPGGGYDLERARQVNAGIPHVVATSFGLSMKHSIGREFLAEYFRHATETGAFMGPWINSNNRTDQPIDHYRCAPCGPASVLGHRHDQTVASVLAWRLGFKLSECPEIFSYGRTGDPDIPAQTILLADGGY